MKMQDRPFEVLIRDAGYESVAKFAEACNLYPQSIFHQVRGEHKPTVDRMFIYARALRKPFREVFEFFYDKELEALDEYLKNTI